MSPRARSSITRSIMESTKVTPAALMACRSIGASSHGLPGSRCPGGVFAAPRPRRCRCAHHRALRNADAGSCISHKSRMVGNIADTSTSSPSRTATTEGPATSGRHTRPASAACAGVVRQHRLQCVTQRGHAESSQSQMRHPILRTNHRRQAHAAVRLVARNRHRSVPGQSY